MSMDLCTAHQLPVDPFTGCPRCAWERDVAEIDRLHGIPTVSVGGVPPIVHAPAPEPAPADPRKKAQRRAARAARRRNRR